MINARRMLDEVIASLRTVIAPAVAEPYPKTQAYMAAVILEMVARQMEERPDISIATSETIANLFASLRKFDGLAARLERIEENEAGLNQLIEGLHADRGALGEKIFTEANQQIRTALRRILNQELKVTAGKAEG